MYVSATFVSINLTQRNPTIIHLQGWKTVWLTDCNQTHVVLLIFYAHSKETALHLYYTKLPETTTKEANKAVEKS